MREGSEKRVRQRVNRKRGSETMSKRVRERKQKEMGKTLRT